jgi:hypothetical protein
MGDTTFLFAPPSFLTGVARTLDLGATLQFCSYYVSSGPKEADERALHSDWRAVGHDLSEAIERFETSVLEPK